MLTSSATPPRPARRRRRHSLGITVTAGLAAALVVTSCGGSSSSDKGKDSAQVAANSVAALKGAESVHVTGHTSATETDAESALDLTFQGANTTGSVTQNGTTLQVIRVDGKSYVKGDKAAYTALAGAAAAALIGDRWLLLSGTDAQSLNNLTLASFAASINTNTKYDSKIDKSSVDGTAALVLTDPADNTKLYVAATGKPYPLKAVKTSSANDFINFNDYNKKVTVVAPADSVDIAQIEKSVASASPSASPSKG
jgi:hypothetical protein